MAEGLKPPVRPRAPEPESEPVPALHCD